MDSEKNFYEILYVSRNAPPSVIKSSYRAIMQKLKVHPDLGGDSAQASLLNEARSVLLDPVKRKAYDKKLESKERPSGKEPAAKQKRPRPEGTDAAAHAEKNAGQSTYKRKRAGRAVQTYAEHSQVSMCPFCRASVGTGESVSSGYENDQRCSRCTSPLKPYTLEDSPYSAAQARLVNRTRYQAPAVVWTEWPCKTELSARICDWSTAGCSIEIDLTHEEIIERRKIRLIAQEFEAIAEVKNARHGAGSVVYGLSFLTLIISGGSGFLYSASA